MVLQLRPTKAERSPSPVKEVPTSLDRTPRDCRQALTCRLPNQNRTRAQRASPSMGPSKPDKEAPELQPTGKGGRSNPLTQTDNHMLYTTLTSLLLLGKHIATLLKHNTYTLSSAALLEPASSREEILHTCDTRLLPNLIRCPCAAVSRFVVSFHLCHSLFFFCFFLLFFSFFLFHYNFLSPLVPSSGNSL